jgi:hypothetical protein
MALGYELLKQHPNMPCDDVLYEVRSSLNRVLYRLRRYSTNDFQRSIRLLWRFRIPFKIAADKLR